MPKFTGQYTKAGRKVWLDESTNEMYSEKTATIPVTRLPDGSPAPGTKWVNVPTVFDGGQIVDDEDFLTKFYTENKFKDPLTNERLKMFNGPMEAVKEAKKRSDSLLEGGPSK